MQSMTVKLFKHEQNQAVRIPKPFQFTETEEVVIRRSGNSVSITPKRKIWKSFAETERLADSEFIQERLAIFETDRVTL